MRIQPGATASEQTPNGRSDVDGGAGGAELDGDAAARAAARAGDDRDAISEVGHEWKLTLRRRPNPATNGRRLEP